LIHFYKRGCVRGDCLAEGTICGKTKIYTLIGLT